MFFVYLNGANAGVRNEDAAGLKSGEGKIIGECSFYQIQWKKLQLNTSFKITVVPLSKSELI